MESLQQTLHMNICAISFSSPQNILEDYGSFETFHGSEQLLLVYVAVTLCKLMLQCQTRKRLIPHVLIVLFFWNALMKLKKKSSDN